MKSVRTGMSRFLTDHEMKLPRSTLLMEPIGLMSAEEPEAVSFMCDFHFGVKYLAGEHTIVLCEICKEG